MRAQLAHQFGSGEKRLRTRRTNRKGSPTQAMACLLTGTAQHVVAVASTGCKNTPPTPHIRHPTMAEHSYKNPETDTDVEAKTGLCLVCKTPFPSAWAGERICRRCKSTEKWRAGLA